MKGSLRVKNIKQSVPLIQVLADLGYRVRVEYGDREQQFQCDLHGDGRDGKPSARLYPDSQSFYCFACGRQRDAVQLVREKRGFSFPEALRYLESTYNITPVYDTEEGDTHEEDHSVEDQWEAEKARCKALFLNLTRDRVWTVQKVAQLWEVFDQICAEKEIGPATAALVKLREGVMVKLAS